MNKLSSGVLILADGTIFTGLSLGEYDYVCGEVVFNTAQTGYQEILTDPSYAEQLIVFTQPHIGNVGVNPADMESHGVHAKGCIVRDFSWTKSNWRAHETLQSFVQRNNLATITGIDTRALTHHLRKVGSQVGCLVGPWGNMQEGLERCKNFSGLLGKDLVKSVTTKQPYTWKYNSWKVATNGDAKSKLFHIVVYDYGVKYSILRCLIDRGCLVTVVPATMKASDVLMLKPDGIVLSNGPGDPAALPYTINAIKQLLKVSLPIMGICLGHQLLAIASGAITKKMTHGHHGANHPILALKDGSVAISSQNHGFVVADEHLPSSLRVTHRSLFDGTIAGIERVDKPAFGFQGHPEARPGPLDLNNLFDHFIAIMQVHLAKANGY